ncbi:TPA: hypothetical protein EYP66_16075 [Candidatus Poribacteria bacterium]|nr:hypothetical protein [Candidatus Poribacteria bacterium]
MQHKNTKENLTELQAAVVEAYRQQLTAHLPDVEILDVFATDRIIEVRLNDVVMRDYSTLNRTTELAIKVEDRFNVTLLPYVVPHEK